MPRRRLDGVADLLFHIVNRGAARQVVFASADDYRDFEQLLDAARRRLPLRLFTYCLMPTHFHLVVWPSEGRQLPLFMQWLTGTYAMRWHVRHGSSGRGAVFQGRYKALPVQAERHFLRLCRYVESNALRAGLVERAEAWPWGGLWQQRLSRPTVGLDPWPTDKPLDWIDRVNAPDVPCELDELRAAISAGRPLGDADFRARAVERFGLRSRPRGRPRKLSTGAWEEGLGTCPEV